MASIAGRASEKERVQGGGREVERERKRERERERMNDGYLSVLNGEDRHGVETRGTKTGREWYRRMRYLPERTIGSQSRAESEYCVYPYARLCDANNLVLLHLLRVPARFFRDWHSFQPFFPSTPSLGLEYLFARYTRVIYVSRNRCILLLLLFSSSLDYLRENVFQDLYR